MNNLALAYWMGKRPRDAIPLFQETLKLRITHLGATHRDTLVSFENLINLVAHLRKLGDVEDAIEVGEHVVGILKEHLPKHPLTSRSMIELAANYQLMPDRVGDAVAKFQEAVLLRKSNPDPADPGAMGAMNALANAYRAAGQNHEALGVFDEIYRFRQTQLDSGDPNLIAAMWNLGAHQQDMQRFEEAEPLLLEVQRQLGPRPEISPVLAKHVVPRLIKLYNAWGKPDEVARWKAALERDAHSENEKSPP
jgi:tetratricopeptide (TPR) repeat protein